MNRNDIAARLKSKFACNESRLWAASYNGTGDIDVNRMWADCPDGEWLVWACCAPLHRQDAYPLRAERTLAAVASLDCLASVVDWAFTGDHPVGRALEPLRAEILAFLTAARTHDYGDTDAGELDDIAGPVNNRWYSGVSDNEMSAEVRSSAGSIVRSVLRFIHEAAGADFDMWYHFNESAKARAYYEWRTSEEYAKLLENDIEDYGSLYHTVCRPRQRRRFADIVRRTIPVPPDWVLRYFDIPGPNPAPTIAGGSFAPEVARTPTGD
jgi:hypothetical protein